MLLVKSKYNKETRTKDSSQQVQDNVITGAMHMNNNLPIIPIYVGSEILKNALQNGGSRGNLITEEEYIRLGLQVPSVPLYWQCMADQAIVDPICLIQNVKIHIQGIPYIINMMVIKNIEVNEAYNMLFCRSWLVDGNNNHD